MQRPEWLPVELDVDRPNAARIYDYFLGGSHNLAADREMARRILAAIPHAPLMAQTNRGFLRRAVRYCLDAGVRQFLDLGSGIPTAGNVHDIAHRVAPDTRVVYVDNEPVAVAHSRVLLAGDERLAVLQADIRDPDRILAEPALHRVLDLSQPVGILMVAVLGFVAEADEPDKIVARYRDAVPPGSHLAICHGVSQPPGSGIERMREFYQGTNSPLVNRDREQLRSWFDGCDVVDPGLVWAQQWRPDWLGGVDEHPERFGLLAAVGRKR
jgi:S-adenosyl methyltransferase